MPATLWRIILENASLMARHCSQRYTRRYSICACCCWHQRHSLVPVKIFRVEKAGKFDCGGNGCRSWMSAQAGQWSEPANWGHISLFKNISSTVCPSCTNDRWSDVFRGGSIGLWKEARTVQERQDDVLYSRLWLPYAGEQRCSCTARPKP